MLSLSSRKSVGIFRNTALYPSEVFISEQLNAMRDYRPVLLCRNMVGKPNVERILNLSDSGRAEFIKFSLLRTAPLFESRIRNAGLGLIHAHFLPDAVLISKIAKNLNLPLVATSHGFDTQMSRWSQFKTKKPSNLQFLLHEHELYADAAAFIAVSNFMRDKMIARGVPSPKIITHYIGVDTKKFTPSPQNSGYVLNVSRHVSWKGVDVVLKAFSLLPKSLGLKLIQVGGGSETPQLHQLATELGISDRVEWRGVQPHSVVRKLMQACSCYVQASMPDRNGQTEAFGMVLLEAAASGVPVIASDSGGMPEAMVENETGYLFQPGNYEELAEKIGFVMGNTFDWRKNMGRAGRNFAISRDLHSQTKLLENIYDRILEQAK